MELFRTHAAGLVVAIVVGILGVLAFFVWRDSQLDQRAQIVETQSEALHDRTAAVFSQLVGHDNFVRGAVEASGDPRLLDTAVALTERQGFTTAAAVIDIGPDTSPRVVSRSGTTRLLEKTLSGPLPVQTGRPLIVDARTEQDGIVVAQVSRRANRLIYLENTLSPEIIEAFADTYGAIDFDVIARPERGESITLFVDPEGADLDATARRDQITGLGVRVELRTQESIALPAAVSRSELIVWELLILITTVATLTAVSVIRKRQRELVTQRARESELLFKSHHDLLTGLPNRTALFEHLEAHPAGPVSLLFIDLDDFKAINDGLGHDVGDLVLACVGRRLRENVRKPDRVFRLGGDEFVVVAEDPNLATLKNRMQRILELPVESGDSYVPIAASVGAASIRMGKGLDPQAALRTADQAMYEDKAVRKALKTLHETGEI